MAITRTIYFKSNVTKETKLFPSCNAVQLVNFEGTRMGFLLYRPYSSGVVILE